MEKILKSTLLYDFYGELLTKKQRLIFEMYHLNDCTLSEIAEEEGVSRQAVSDALKRTEKILEQYEEKLGLVEKFEVQKKYALRIKKIIETAEKNGGAPEYIKEIKSIIENLPE